MFAGDSRYFDIAIGADITGWTLYMTAKLSTADPDAEAVFQKTSPSGGITITDAAVGDAVAQIDPADTETYQEEGATLLYDVQAFTDNNETYTVDDGTIVLQPAVTHTNTLP